MVLERIDPEGLATPQTYSHVIVGDGSRLAFVAGQVAEDAEGRLVGAGDFDAQARQVFVNLGRALSAAGAAPPQVARLGIFVVGLDLTRHLPAIETARRELFGDHRPVDTLLGVAALAHPGCLIEVDAIALLSG